MYTHIHTLIAFHTIKQGGIRDKVNLLTGRKLARMRNRQGQRALGKLGLVLQITLVQMASLKTNIQSPEETQGTAVSPTTKYYQS